MKIFSTSNRVLPILAAFLWWDNVLSAATLFTAQANTDGGTDFATSTTGVAVASREYLDARTRQTVSANAGPGGVGVGLRVDLFGTGGLTQFAGATGFASSEGEIIISGPTSTVNASVVMKANGADRFGVFPGQGGSTGKRFSFTAPGFNGVAAIDILHNPDGSQTVFDGFVGFSTNPFGGGSTTLMFFNSPQFTLPVGVPIAVYFELAVSAGVNSNAIGQTSFVEAGWADTFGWTDSGPAIILPDGYFANGAGLVNNFGPQAAGVPEPGSLSLGALGILAAAAYGFRTRRAIRKSTA